MNQQQIKFKIEGNTTNKFSLPFFFLRTIQFALLNANFHQFACIGRCSLSNMYQFDYGQSENRDIYRAFPAFSQKIIEETLLCKANSYIKNGPSSVVE